MKKTMKKLAALLTVSTVAVGMLAGCGNSDNGASDNKGTSAASEDSGKSDGTYKIAMCQQHQTNAYQISITEAAQAKAKELGSDFIVVGRPITQAADPVAAYRRCVAEFVG